MFKIEKNKSMKLIPDTGFLLKDIFSGRKNNCNNSFSNNHKEKKCSREIKQSNFYII